MCLSTQIHSYSKRPNGKCVPKKAIKVMLGVTRVRRKSHHNIEIFPQKSKFKFVYAPVSGKISFMLK